jgi:hypothetical protein
MSAGVVAWLLATAPLVGLVVNIFVQFVVHRFLPHLPIVFSYFVGLLGGVFSTVVVIRSVAEQEAGWAAILIGVATVGGLSFCYSNLVNLFYSSLRVRLLARLLLAGGDLPQEAIMKCYGSDAVVDDRLNRLVSWRQIEQRDGRVYSRKGWLLSLTSVFVIAKHIFLGHGFRFETADRS